MSLVSKSGFNVARADIRLTIESVTYANNSIGEPIPTWATYKTIYAERLKPPSGIRWEERFEASQQVAPNIQNYRVRHDDTITETMRCFEGDNTGANGRLYFRSVNHFKREGYSEIIALQRDNQ